MRTVGCRLHGGMGVSGARICSKGLTNAGTAGGNPNLAPGGLLQSDCCASTAAPRGRRPPWPCGTSPQPVCSVAAGSGKTTLLLHACRCSCTPAHVPRGARARPYLYNKLLQVEISCALADAAPACACGTSHGLCTEHLNADCVGDAKPRVHC
eukprot:scaffold17100_cov140-Isochrysis_galbana.AAC.1